jgi:hypothetical protein
MRIVLACMDRRMNEILEREYGNAETVIVRNAGADVEGLRRTMQKLVEENDVTEICIVPHTDCGAMKAVVLKLKDNDPRMDDETFAALVGQFKAQYGKGNIKDNADAERINYDLQCRHAEDLFKGTDVTSELVELHAGAHHGENAMLAMKPCGAGEYGSAFKAADKERDRCYVVQASFDDEMVRDVKLGIQVVGIRELFFVAPSKDRKDTDDAKRRKDAIMAALKPRLSQEEFGVVERAKVVSVERNADAARLRNR